MGNKWQDKVLSVGNLLLALFLLPTVFGENKPELLTIIPTAAILFSFSYVFFTLGLTKSYVSVTIAASLWVVLAIQVVI